jgi:hypothetical protein
MTRRKLTIALAAAAATMAFSGSAQASVIDTDGVRLTGTGYDFGNATFVAGAPTGDGDLKFDYTGGQIKPHLTGTLHMNDADGTCARMHLDYRDRNGTSLRIEHGGTVCVNDDKHHEFSVDLQPYSDNRIASVLVQLEKETVSGWFVVDNAVYTANTFDDSVKITEDGVDFGATNTFLGNAPTGSGTMHWTLIDGQVTARLTGSIYINNSSGVCSRMNLRYLTSGGTFLTSRSGGEVCADDNGLHQFTVNLDPYTSNKVGKVDVQLQTQGSNGSWNTAGSQTVSIAE